MAWSPRSPQHPGEDIPTLKKRHDREICQACDDWKTNSDIQASTAQERTRVQNMDTANFVANWATRTSQEDARVQNMDPETSAAHKKTRTSQEYTRVQNMDPEE